MCKRKDEAAQRLRGQAAEGKMGKVEQVISVFSVQRSRVSTDQHTVRVLPCFFNSWRLWQPFPSLLNIWKVPFFFSLHSLFTQLTLHCHGNDVTVSHLHISLLLNIAKEHGSVQERKRERQRRRNGSVSLETDWGSPQPPLVLNWLESACYPQCLEPTGSLFLGCLCTLCFCVSYACTHKLTHRLWSKFRFIYCHCTKQFILRFVLW